MRTKLRTVWSAAIIIAALTAAPALYAEGASPGSQSEHDHMQGSGISMMDMMAMMQQMNQMMQTCNDMMKTHHHDDARTSDRRNPTASGTEATTGQWPLQDSEVGPVVR